MGRIRTIKPEAFLDEDLWDLGEESGLPVFQAFVGLWTQADREGRFEWSPRRLKVAILPYWEGDFSRVLDALCTRGFLVKYASGTRVYGSIRTFKKHQVINNKERKSEIPAPTENLSDSSDLTCDSREGDALGARDLRKGREGKGKEREGRERGGVAPVPSRSPPADYSPNEILVRKLEARLQGVDLPALLELFQTMEFQYPRSDWDRAFEKFALTQRDPPKLTSRAHGKGPLTRLRELAEAEERREQGGG